jgi:DNA-binding transcriptional LysR family regulator
MDYANKPHWDDLETVLTLVEQGSLAGAAAALGVNYTTVARRVTRIEQALGKVLFHRLADGYRPTDAGRIVAEHAALMQQNEDALLRKIKGQDSKLTGALVVTAPQLWVAYVLPEAIADFTEAHPDVDLQIRATNDILDLSRGEADLALRSGRTLSDALTGLRLTGQDTASFASPRWADQIVNEPDKPIDWIIYAAYKTLPNEVMTAYPSSRIRYRFDDMIAMAGAAASGLGVVRMPMVLGRRMAGLVQVPLLKPKPYADIWMVAHKDVWHGAKPKAFREAVRKSIKSDQAVFVA